MNDAVDWMATYAKNRELEIYQMHGIFDPFCFLRVPHAADKILHVNARQSVGETQIVCSLTINFPDYIYLNTSYLQ